MTSLADEAIIGLRVICLKEVNVLTEPIKPGPDDFFGTVNVGERGQVVIPAEVRKKMDIHTGDKLVVLVHPAKQGVMLLKIGAMREFIDDLTAKLSLAEAGHAHSESE